MNLQSVKSKTKAKSTFYKHGLENERQLLYQYNRYPDTLDPQLVLDLDVMKATTSYPRRYDKHSDEKKAALKAGYLSNKMREKLKECLGPGGHPPPRKTLIFSKFTPDMFGEYLCDKRKKDGSLMKPGSYKGYRSGLSYLFKRYKEKMNEEAFDEVSEILQGVKRTANEARAV